MTIFENIKRINEYGNEYWSARKLAKSLEYSDYRNFQVVINKAMQACKNSSQDIFNHFGEATNMIPTGKTAKREVSDYHLSRYVCYLIVQNANPAKETVTLGQTLPALLICVKF